MSPTTTPGPLASGTRASATGRLPTWRPSFLKPLLWLHAILVLGFICIPVIIVVPMSFSDASSLQFPPPDWSLRWYRAFLHDPVWVEAVVNSFAIAALSSTIALVLGSAAAYGAVRRGGLFARFTELNAALPLIVPTIIIAIALYIFQAKAGMLGSYAGLVAAHTVLSVPYVVLLMSLAIRAFDVRIEQAALTLGASWSQMAFRILAPNLLPMALTSWIFAFITSFDEVVVTLFVGGTIDTVPKKMFTELRMQINPTVTAIATMLVAVSVVSLAVMGFLASKAKAVNLGRS